MSATTLRSLCLLVVLCFTAAVSANHVAHRLQRRSVIAPAELMGPSSVTPAHVPAASAVEGNVASIASSQQTAPTTQTSPAQSPASPPASLGFNDLTITSERDTHVSSVQPAPAAAGGVTLTVVDDSNNNNNNPQQPPQQQQLQPAAAVPVPAFNDLTITVDRDTHAKPVAAKSEVEAAAEESGGAESGESEAAGNNENEQDEAELDAEAAEEQTAEVSEEGEEGEEESADF